MSGPADKSFEISKRLVWEAYERVKANKGAAGVDGQSIEDFETDLKGNLYKIWNRMSSGTYFPPPVKAVEIPKPRGNEDARGADGGRSDRADGGRADVGAPDGVDLSRRLLRVSAQAVGVARGRAVPTAVLEEGLGPGFGCPEVLRLRGSRPDGQGGGGEHTSSGGWCCM